MKITTADEMRAIDRRTYDEYHVPSLNLMEAAGTACAELAMEAFPEARRIAVVCGKGNNGGDGFVAARKLREAGRQPRVILLASAGELKDDAAVMFERMGLPHVEVRTAEELRAEAEQRFGNADLVIDAILGTGFRPPVTGLYAGAIQAIDRSELPVVAVDIPSGADSDSFQMQRPALADGSATKRGAAGEDADLTICRADAICTFTAPRPAHVFGNLTNGPVRVAPIGSPEEAIQSALKLEVITPQDIAPLLAPRAVDANKGRFGHALTIGGSVGKAGAAAMAGIAALRAGAGLSTVATAASVLPTVAGFAYEIMTEPLAETDAGTISLSAMEYGRVDKIVEGKNVIAIGPGISRHADTVQFVRAAVGKYRQAAMVIDADGLNAFEGAERLLVGRDRTLVLTPHPGEMARLAGVASPKEVQADRLKLARKFACEHHLILVLKGWRTLVALPDETVWVNPTGNPGMASGGTGDVLTGMIAGMLAQFPNDTARAVCAAVYLHGLAGDVARESAGEQALIAGDLIECLPEAMQRAKEWAGERLVRIQ
ncbi:MAG: NAD(P)H-hydrate dehydratase [Terriglobales bacterium]